MSHLFPSFKAWQAAEELAAAAERSVLRQTGLLGARIAIEEALTAEMLRREASGWFREMMSDFEASARLARG